MATPPKDPTAFVKRANCPSCQAKIPVMERDANEFVHCFCGEKIPAGPKAWLLLARRSIAVAGRNIEKTA